MAGCIGAAMMEQRGMVVDAVVGSIVAEANTVVVETAEADVVVVNIVAAKCRTAKSKPKLILRPISLRWKILC